MVKLFTFLLVFIPVVGVAQSIKLTGRCVDRKSKGIDNVQLIYRINNASPESID